MSNLPPSPLAELQYVFDSIERRIPNDSWVALTPSGSWTNLAGYESLAYRLFGLNLMMLRGVVTGGAANAVAALPIKPTANIVRPSVGHVGGVYGVVELLVDTTGVLQVHSPLGFPAGTDYYSVGCILDTS